MEVNKTVGKENNAITRPIERPARADVGILRGQPIIVYHVRTKLNAISRYIVIVIIVYAVLPYYQKPSLSSSRHPQFSLNSGPVARYHVL
jgi:hypothetical protein